MYVYIVCIHGLRTQGVKCCRDCKAHSDKFVICDFGLDELKLIWHDYKTHKNSDIVI